MKLCVFDMLPLSDHGRRRKDARGPGNKFKLESLGTLQQNLYRHAYTLERQTVPGRFLVLSFFLKVFEVSSYARGRERRRYDLDKWLVTCSHLATIVRKKPSSERM